MDERETDPKRPTSPNLKAAMRRARIEAAAHSGAVDDLRRAEIARLELLEEAVRPLTEQAGVDLFDLGIAQGEKPRLFLDMIAHVDLGPDRRTYRFYQDTRHGRVLIAENARAEKIVAAMTNYVARRLLEREQALESDRRGRRRASAAAHDDREPAQPPPRAGLAPWVDALGFLLMTVGAFTLFALAAVSAWLLWTGWGHAIGAAVP